MMKVTSTPSHEAKIHGVSVQPIFWLAALKLYSCPVDVQRLMKRFTEWLRVWLCTWLWYNLVCVLCYSYLSIAFISSESDNTQMRLPFYSISVKWRPPKNKVDRKFDQISAPLDSFYKNTRVQTKVSYHFCINA